jgi:LAGLIDADG-like domain
MRACRGAHYAYLLGVYLGDGCISRDRRTYRMRITLDSSYPGVVAECVRALETIRPGKKAWQGKRPRSRCVDVSMCWNHWPCLFPQHGPGRKHLRRIALESWQREIVDEWPRELLRGLFHSDGCRVIANDRGIASVRYHFSNRSEDIKRILSDALDLLGIPWTRPCSRQIAIYTKAGVARLDEFVGPKR